MPQAALGALNAGGAVHVGCCRGRQMTSDIHAVSRREGRMYAVAAAGLGRGRGTCPTDFRSPGRARGRRHRVEGAERVGAPGRHLLITPCTGGRG